MTPPYQPAKPSILDRLVSRLFPATQMLDPQMGQSVGRQGLMQLGANLLQAGGASPQQRGTLANIGAALGGVDINALTKNAMAMQAYQSQQAAQQKIGEIAARHPPKEGETPDQIYDRVAAMVSELAGQPGTEDLLGKLSNVLAQLRPQRELRQRYKWETVMENGVPVRYRVNVDDPSDRIRIGTPYDPYANEQRPFTEDQGKLADYGTRVLEAHSVMTRLEREHPGIGQQVDLKIRPLFTADKVPGLGSAVGSIITPGILAAMSPEEREYWGAQQDLVNARLRRVTGATINRQELETERMPLVPLGGEDESQVAKKQARRLQAARLYIRGAGRAFSPDFLSDEARALFEGQPPTPPRAPRSWRDLDPDK